ncbi:TPA: LysE/ArgO family amino acid transporter [Photobacterium damselae]
MIEIAIKGALLSGSMIIAIGSQNAFLLKAGLSRHFVFSIATVCFLGDVLLMSLGVFGVGKLISQHSSIQIIVAMLGALFLFWYGYCSLKSAYKGESRLSVKEGSSNTTRITAIASALAVTFLNPHVYLDTVVIVGGFASQFTVEQKFWFLAGSLLASSIWFYGLGYTATKITPIFRKKITWQILDICIALIMFYIAVSLLFGVQSMR